MGDDAISIQDGALSHARTALTDETGSVNVLVLDALIDALSSPSEASVGRYRDAAQNIVREWPHFLGISVAGLNLFRMLDEAFDRKRGRETVVMPAYSEFVCS